MSSLITPQVEESPLVRYLIFEQSHACHVTQIPRDKSQVVSVFFLLVLIQRFSRFCSKWLHFMLLAGDGRASRVPFDHALGAPMKHSSDTVARGSLTADRFNKHSRMLHALGERRQPSSTALFFSQILA